VEVFLLVVLELQIKDMMVVKCQATSGWRWLVVEVLVQIGDQATGGTGGAGLSSSITGSSVARGGGGG
jgi:hypothetical protein